MRQSQVVRHENTFSVIFANAIASFPHVIKPTMNTIDKDPSKHYEEYTIDLLFPKSTDLSELEQVFEELKKDTWPDGAPAFRNTPIKDGDQKMNLKTGEVYEGYAGMWYITAKSDINNKPTVIDPAKQVMDRPDAIIGGDIVHGFVGVFTYNYPVNKGISFGLNTIKLVEKTDAPFGGGISSKIAATAMDAFDDADMI